MPLPDHTHTDTGESSQPAPTASALESAGWRLRALPGYASRFGPIWTRRDDDGWAYGVLATAEHLNPVGLVHGGMLSSLLDHAVTAVAWEALARQPCVTVQLDMQFLRAGREGQFLEARGSVTHATGSLMFMQGAVSHAGQTLCLGSAVVKRLK